MLPTEAYTEELFYNTQQFQWAPTLGGECYVYSTIDDILFAQGFNGHPPLGVNATV